MAHPLSDPAQELYDLIITARRAEAVDVLLATAGRTGFKNMVSGLLEPVLTRIGENWMAERISLAQGYVAGKVAEDVLMTAARSGEQWSGERKGPAVLCCIEDDFHALGRKLVGVFLRSAGWDVIDMGDDVCAADLVDRAVSAGARVVGASAMMLSTAMNIRSVREELARRGLEGRIQLAVGGAIFRLRPELVQEVGGDGTAESALQAPALFDSLLARSLALAPEVAP
ncbi:cobalamin B12-binding domain-containing protein [Fundidesulfovibrio terrae]|uniref:cobalamin B12-binding domain-containing protein n=1 Tax=Fundidesulfovibrio terrae TaxID=2922866 RepID=UPI001FAFCDE3|nr:cobalamin-dependent protein [Fundidesulfovibrio terrae]